MGGRVEQDTILTEIKDLQRRLSKLERYDRDRTEFYNPETGGSETGRVLYDGDGNIVQAITSDVRGMLYPHDMTQFVPSPTMLAPLSITTAAWVTIGEIEMQAINGTVIQFGAALSVPSGTTAGVRIWDASASIAYATQTTAGVKGNLICEWLHPYSIGFGNLGANASSAGATANLQYQVQNNNATGTVTAYMPRSLMIRNHRFTLNESLTTPFAFS